MKRQQEDMTMMYGIRIAEMIITMIIMIDPSLQPTTDDHHQHQRTPEWKSVTRFDMTLKRGDRITIMVAVVVGTTPSWTTPVRPRICEMAELQLF